MDYLVSDQVIGRGGMGVVLRGKHRSLDREVAVKVLSNELAGDPEFVERFMREARLSAKVHHPNVVTVHDAGTDQNGRPYLVMELLIGESLRERMRRERIPPEDARQIAIGVLRALSAAHRQGIFHRDVKPGNIFLTSDGQVKLMDFGIATALSETRLTSTGGFVGTAEYMAPEQVQGKKVDGRADLYALGIVYMEMLSGRVPFSGDTLSILHRQVNELAPSIREADPQTNAILGRFLAKDPNSRFANAEEAIEALEGRRKVQPVKEDAEERARPISGMVAFGSAAVVIVLGVGLALRSSAGTTHKGTNVPAQQPATAQKPQQALDGIEHTLTQANTTCGYALTDTVAIINADESRKAVAEYGKRRKDDTGQCLALSQQGIDDAKQARSNGVPVSKLTIAALEMDRAFGLYAKGESWKPATTAAEEYLRESGPDTQPGMTSSNAIDRRRDINKGLEFFRKDPPLLP
jgi:hypothetical protein